MHHPTDRIAHITAFVTPVVEHWMVREIAQWVHPMKDRSDDPSLHLAPQCIASHVSSQKEIYFSVKSLDVMALNVFIMCNDEFYI